MLRFDVRHVLDDAERDAIVALVATVHDATGDRPLSDQAWLDLVHGGPSWHAAVLGRSADGSLRTAAMVGRSASSPGPDATPAVSTAGPAVAAWTIELVLDHDDPARHALAHGTLAAAHDEIVAAGGGEVSWWVFDAHDDADALAASIGLAPGRSLLQMRVGLPLDPAARGHRPPIHTRAFEVGRDEAAWLEVNNAAFAWHPEQGNWDLATLELREREDWFDPAGFLLHERDGRLAAFCWTKLHHDHHPVLGEIYVIAVHPDAHGHGLGRALTVAGLDHIVGRGVTDGMLFVDRDNTAAVGLYESLGFHVHRTDRAYTGHITGHTGHTSQEQP